MAVLPFPSRIRELTWETQPERDPPSSSYRACSEQPGTAEKATQQGKWAAL